MWHMSGISKGASNFEGLLHVPVPELCSLLAPTKGEGFFVSPGYSCVASKCAVEGGIFDGDHEKFSPAFHVLSDAVKPPPAG